MRYEILLEVYEMALHFSKVAEKIQELLRKNGVDVVTLTWPDFYAISERERIKVEFQSELTRALKGLGLLVCYGDAIVLIAKDFAFGRVKL